MTPAQELVLDCYRSPHLLRSLSDHSIPLPEGVGRLIRVAMGEEPLELGAAELTSIDELRRATLLYVKRVVLVDGGDYYRSLGVRADASAEQIDSNYRGLLALLQADDEESTASLCDYVLRVSKAYSIVGDSVRRRMYERTRLSLLGNDELELPVDAVVDEVLGTIRRPTEPIESTAHVEPTWHRSARPAESSAPPEPPVQAVVDEPEPVAEEVAEPAVQPRKFSDQVLIGVSLVAIAVIALVTPVLIARYSLLVPQWHQVADTSALMPPASAPPASMPQQQLPFETAPSLLAMSEPVPLGQVPLDQSEAVFSSAPFDEGADESEEVLGAVPEDLVPTQLNDVKAAPASAPPAVVTAPVKTAAPVAMIAPTKPAPAAVASVAPIAQALAPVATSADATAPPPAPSPQSVSQTVAAVLAEPERPVPPPVAVFPTELIIPRNDLNRLVERLEATYQDGDLFKFSGLFAIDARTNDRVDRVGIREDYEQLFSSTETRQFSLSNMKWRYEGERAVGTGDFMVRIKPRWKNRDEVFSGRVEMRVQREGDSLVISEMYHDYR